MEMEYTGEFTESSDHAQIVRGKRTKRQRPSSPFAAAVTSSSSSGGGIGDGGGCGNLYFSIQSPTTSSDISASTEEDEDMVNCLIMLAQSVSPITKSEEDKTNHQKTEKLSSRRFTEIAAAATTTGKAGFYVYECKTCNRTFPSFQALGGHRASHKKPKAAAMVIEEKIASTPPPILDYEEVQEEERKVLLNKSINSPPGNFVQIGNNKTKVHECSICGSEFLSGQALGGHMRRHRTIASSSSNSSPPNTRIAMNNIDTTTDDITEKPRSMLSLDLNLPAPEEDHGFQFTPPTTNSQQHLVFSAAPALVDCHY